ncbi:MAG: hypothetical protein EXR75_11860 [Myxococcales bacterium]|nr:hypothetical protein [Myxococcales bacterium]
MSALKATCFEWDGAPVRVQARYTSLLVVSLTVGCGAAGVAADTVTPSSRADGTESSSAFELARSTESDAMPFGRALKAKSAEDTRLEAKRTPDEVEAGAAPVDTRPRLYAPSGLVKFHEKPDRDSPVIGAMRAGQSVAMRDTTLTPERKRRRLYGCDEGWYPVFPRGFACVGGADHATRNAQEPRVIAALAALPDVTADYPFKFGVSLGAPQYKRVPTAAEQRVREPDLDKYLASLPGPDPQKGGAIDVTPAGRPPSEAFANYQRTTVLPLMDEQPAYPGMKVAWTQEFDAEGRTWLLTPDMTLVPKDKVRQKALPSLHGVDFKARPELKLPLAFFWLDDTPKFRMGTDGKLAKSEEMFSRHEFVNTTLKQARGPGGSYWQVGDNAYVPHNTVSIIKRAPFRAPGAGPHDKWVEIRVTWGYLIAYEGDEPVYATAMSPGQDGIANAKYATARGVHYVDWKMYSSDMSGHDKGADWYVQEVPWVQYYKDNFAAHGAWWHNDFGRPRSHGCVNLAPADARFLFRWMDPVIPEGWYAVSPYAPHAKSSIFYIRP